MRQTTAPWSSVDVLDQWGIQFPLLPEELDELGQPTSWSLARAISSWRLSIATAWPEPDDALDQWGIEFPIPDGEFPPLARYRSGGCLQARSLVLGGRLRGMSQAGVWAAILAVVVAGSALAVNPPASDGAAPPDSAPMVWSRLLRSRTAPVVLASVTALVVGRRSLAPEICSVPALMVVVPV